MSEDYPRDWQGYANQPPNAQWPDGARIAINFIFNYEEGGERNILDGDAESESYLTDIPNLVSLLNDRNHSAESMFAYGSRVGCWRLVNLFDHYQIPITVFAVGLALERNLAFCEYLKRSSHEVAGHGYRWKDYREVALDDERQDIIKTLTVIKNLIHKTPVGWYTGRKSQNTRQLIVEQGLLYDSEDYNDDLPFWATVQNKKHLVIPYTLDCNDCRYVTPSGWSSPEEFLFYLKASFDCLYEEGKSYPKIMTIGLHPRLSGRPGRAQVIKSFIEYIKKHDKVWLCRRQDIAEHWQKHFSN